MNAWDEPRFVSAVRQTGRRNCVLAGLWSEACVAFAALQMLEDGYGIYVVKDASHGANPVAHDMALRRVEQAGGVSVTALQVLLELQRDWGRPEHCQEVRAIVQELCGGQSPGAKAPGMGFPHAPAGRQRRVSQPAAQRKEINR